MCGLYVKLNPTLKYVAMKIWIINYPNPQSIIMCEGIKQILGFKPNDSVLKP